MSNWRETTDARGYYDRDEAWVVRVRRNGRFIRPEPLPVVFPSMRAAMANADRLGTDYRAERIA